MFETLSGRLSGVFDRLTRQGALSDDDVATALREVRVALLEADVSLPVARDFVKRVEEKARGQAVTKSVTPGQQVVKIVHDELVRVLAGDGTVPGLRIDSPPAPVLMVGLQGSGKTTTTAKLARRLKERDGKRVLMASLDTRRPAAMQQLAILGTQVGVDTLPVVAGQDPVAISRRARQQASLGGYDVLLLDTAGRLHVDDELMAELARIRKQTKPHDVLLVVDAMTGQDAVGVAEAFAGAAEFDGVVMTKLDGDARGGAALSVKAVTGKPIIFASTGERLEDFERFHPDRMAGRILGMGDVLSLIEKAEKEVDADQAVALQERMRKAQFTLEDFLGQMRQVRRMGPIGNLLGMLPGMGGLKELQGADVDERELDRLEAMILSMTPQERSNPELINGSRRRRIAAGSGVKVQQVNQLVKQFDQTRKLMKRVASGKAPDPQQLMQELGGAQRPKIRRR
jgi:signal recognition particle subunit SRP54